MPLFAPNPGNAIAVAGVTDLSIGERKRRDVF